MITTSRYEENGFADIIRGLVKIYDPKIVVELGTQQGASAIIIGQALNHGQLWTYDLFLDKYIAPPHLPTHASIDIAKYSVAGQGLSQKVHVCFGEALSVYKEYDKVDMLHIDICNWYNPIHTLLLQWKDKVNKSIILEGGGYTYWQRKHKFRPYTSLLSKRYITDLYQVTTIKKNEDYALTILIRKEKDVWQNDTYV